jgi:hypothetical protein
MSKRVSKKRWLRLLLLAFIVVAGALTPLDSEAATFQGQVVDAETGEPLEGAVIVIVWYQRVLFVSDENGAVFPCMDSCYAFAEAREVVTDPQGDFTIDLARWGLWSQRTSEIFKPGYRRTGLWSAAGEEPMPKEPIIRLSKLKSSKQLHEYWYAFSTCSPDPKDRSRWCVPRDRITNYVRLKELEQKLYRSRGW